MEWYHVIAIMGGNLAVILPLWLWNRTEANADRREITALTKEIQREMKDFHGRLCAIEERYRSKP